MSRVGELLVSDDLIILGDYQNEVRDKKELLSSSQKKLLNYSDTSATASEDSFLLLSFLFDRFIRFTKIKRFWVEPGV